MQEASKLQKTVMALAVKHNIDLDRPGAYLRLEKEECGQLVIENIGGERVSVTNYIQVSRDWVADPEIVFYVGLLTPDPATEETLSLWFPIEINQLFGGWQLCGELDQRGDLVIYDEATQFEMAQLAEGTMATVLIAQNWLELGRRSSEAVHTWTSEEIQSRDIRVEEMGDIPF